MSAPAADQGGGHYSAKSSQTIFSVFLLTTADFEFSKEAAIVLFSICFSMMNNVERAPLLTRRDLFLARR